MVDPFIKSLAIALIGGGAAALSAEGKEALEQVRQLLRSSFAADHPLQTALTFDALPADHDEVESLALRLEHVATRASEFDERLRAHGAVVHAELGSLTTEVVFELEKCLYGMSAPQESAPLVTAWPLSLVAESGEHAPVDLWQCDPDETWPRIELSVYTSADEPSDEMLSALDAVLEQLGMEATEASDIERTSWFRRWRLRTKHKGAWARLAKLADQLARVGTLYSVNSQVSEVGGPRAGGLACINEALRHEPSAVIQLSSIILVKNERGVAVRALPEDELRVLRENPDLVKSPSEILDVLSARVREPARQAAADEPLIPPLPGVENAKPMPCRDEDV